MNFRTQLKTEDIEDLKEILISSGFFYPSEVSIIKELAEENITKGEKSGYIFNLAENKGKIIAFTCYGHVPGTASSYDLYWIATHQSQRGQGIGKTMLDKVVDDIRHRGGKNIWIETASRELYAPTRAFYEAYGCKKIAELPEFYGPDDNKITYWIPCPKEA